MDNNRKSNQNNSMFLYTALIFAVALILIILAFFGQTNLSALRSENDAVPTPDQIEETLSPTEPATQPPQDELARLVNQVSVLTAENENLKNKVNLYDNLLSAYAYVSSGDIESAKPLIEGIDVNALTDNQKELYNVIITNFN